MRKLIGAAALLAALGAAACGGHQREPAQAPAPTQQPAGVGAMDARSAVARFLGAVTAQDLQSLGAVWGTKDGPVRDVGGMNREELEKRELLIMCYLRHDRYRVVTENPGTSGERVLSVELTAGPLTRTTNFYAVTGPSGRWFVRSVDLDPVADLCRRGRR